MGGEPDGFPTRGSARVGENQIEKLKGSGSIKIKFKKQCALTPYALLVWGSGGAEWVFSTASLGVMYFAFLQRFRFFLFGFGIE